jgi:aryl-alcohol dehydrogenase-like predicted oxidoreductase
MLPIPGTSRLEHLEENTAVAHVELSAKDFADLDAQGKRERKAQAGR